MKKYIIIPLLFLFLPYAAGAATARIVQEPAEVGAGDTVVVSLQVDASNPINTFSGELSFSREKLQLLKVSNGGSIINIWITDPREKDGSIPFEGLVPGGYAGRGGLLFTAFFKAKAAGEASVSLNDAVFLRNDGSGSAEDVSIKSLVIHIAAQPLGGFKEIADTDPPEPFYIQLGQSTDFFDGRFYIAFTAADKLSGISHYEAAERRIPFMPLRWSRVGSPSELKDQYLTGGVYVKAVDNAGNERIAEYPRTHVLRPYEWLILGILIVAALFVYVKKRSI